MPLNLFYTMVQKSQKWPKTQIKGGSCLKLKTGHARDNLFVFSASRICELKNLALDVLNSLLK